MRLSGHLLHVAPPPRLRAACVGSSTQHLVTSQAWHAQGLCLLSAALLSNSACNSSLCNSGTESQQSLGQLISLALAVPMPSQLPPAHGVRTHCPTRSQRLPCTGRMAGTHQSSLAPIEAHLRISKLTCTHPSSLACDCVSFVPPAPCRTTSQPNASCAHCG
eukprot:scaffold4516_cov19-Tisochrysis_lutea.AAC.2